MVLIWIRNLNYFFSIHNKNLLSIIYYEDIVVFTKGQGKKKRDRGTYHFSGHVDSSFKEKETSFLNSSPAHKDHSYGISKFPPTSLSLYSGLSLFSTFFPFFQRCPFVFIFIFGFCGAWLLLLLFLFLVVIEVVDDTDGAFTVTAFDASHYLGN